MKSSKRKKREMHQRGDKSALAMWLKMPNECTISTPQETKALYNKNLSKLAC